MTAVTFERLGHEVGAEVKGVDRERIVSDEAMPSVLGDALEKYGVLVFRDLHLDPEAQVEFCSKLGPIDRSLDEHPVSGIYVVSLDPKKTATARLLKGTFDWHIDGCVADDGANPQMATMLTAKALSDSGGETEFASSYGAYDALSEQEKDKCLSLRVLHTVEATQRGAVPDPTPEQLAAWRARPTREHPLVWTHKTGRRSLVLGASTDHVIGMDVDEGRALLDDLLDRSTSQDKVYRHEWSHGDTVIWDNRGVLHRAAPYDPNSGREMLRTTILGDEPIQ